MSNNCFKNTLTQIYVRDKLRLKEGIKMKTLIKNFGGAIFFYLAVIGMVLMVSSRFKELYQEENTAIAYVEEK